MKISGWLVERHACSHCLNDALGPVVALKPIVDYRRSVPLTKPLFARRVSTSGAFTESTFQQPAQANPDNRKGRHPRVVIHRSCRTSSAVRSKSATAGDDDDHRQGEDAQVAAQAQVLDVVTLDREPFLERQLAAPVDLHRPRQPRLHRQPEPVLVLVALDQLDLLRARARPGSCFRRGC